MPIIPYLGGNGTLTVRVVNPLVSQAIANTTIFIFARAKNLDVQAPDNLIPWYNEGGDPINLNFYSDLFLQGAVGDDTEEESSHALVPYAGHIPSDMLYFGEKIQSVRALMQKPCRLQRLISSDLFQLPQLRIGPDIAASTDALTYAYYYSQLFTGIAASERFKVFSATTNDYFVSFSRGVNADGTLTTFPTNYFPQMATYSWVGPQKGHEGSIPYYNPRKYLVPNTKETSPRSVSQIQYDRTVSVHVETFYSLGPDIRAVCFIQVPAIYTRTAPGPCSFGPWGN
jgi:hypothetical protein